MSFSEKLKKLRINSGLTQAQLAQLLNLSHQAVSKYETGNVYPDVENIVRLSGIFGVSTDYLLRDELTKDSLIGVHQKNVSVELQNVLIEISSKTGVSIEDILGNGKDPNLVHVRRMAMYTMKKCTGASYSEIANVFHGRELVTIIHGINMFEECECIG